MCGYGSSHFGNNANRWRSALSRRQPMLQHAMAEEPAASCILQQSGAEYSDGASLMEAANFRTMQNDEDQQYQGGRQDQSMQRSRSQRSLQSERCAAMGTCNTSFQMTGSDMKQGIGE